MVLQGTRAHPTAQEIYEEVRKQIPNISKGTVYRNLQVLNMEGLVSELNLNGALSRFEVKQGDHYHFRCEQCGRVFDAGYPVEQDLNSKVAAKTGFNISSHQLEFRGICHDCQKPGGGKDDVTIENRY